MRHQLGTRASSGRYPLSTRDLLTAFEMVIGWATRQDGLSATQLEALSEMISKVSWKNLCKFCLKMSKTSLRFCVVCWLTKAKQPSRGSVLFTHSAQLNHPLPSPNTLSYSRYVLGSIHLRLESIRKTEQLLKILRLSGITLLPVVFGVNHYYRCLVTTLPLSRKSGDF